MSSNNKKDILTKGTKTNKTFNYAKNGVTLDFTLSVDDTSQLRDFLSLIKEATKDVEDTIDTLKN